MFEKWRKINWHIGRAGWISAVHLCGALIKWWSMDLAIDRQIAAAFAKDHAYSCLYCAGA